MWLRFSSERGSIFCIGQVNDKYFKVDIFLFLCYNLKVVYIEVF